ncbi:MAG: SAM-dependent chlorinase/fluorinase [Chloroflexi bacterium]|nr:SAM-dependent chlorinase/fluorinase [Chloroflexota bacterium]
MTHPPIQLPENAPSPIAITTDFGAGSPYVAALKGVILDILPWAKIIDVTHEIEPQNIQQAAYVLSAIADYFPRSTVHLVVVDPGVGGERRPIAVYTERACYVGPDNGVFSAVYAREHVKEIRLLQNPFYRLPKVSHTFHGRDIFAPFAAYIASGAPCHSLGPVVTDPVRIHLPEPRRLADGRLEGQIIFVDRFGNLISNIPAEWLTDNEAWVFEVAGQLVRGFHATYSDATPGELLALSSSGGLLEIAVREGSAARRLAAGVGEPICARREQT